MMEETQEQLNDEPSGSDSGSEMMVLATPGDRLLSYIVDALIFIGIAILGGIIGVDYGVGSGGY